MQLTMLAQTTDNQFSTKRTHAMNFWNILSTAVSAANKLSTVN